MGSWVGAPVDAQQDDDWSVFVESVHVNVVNVDVRVTDKKGNPVEGLTIDDFEIFEEGRPVQISNFYVIENGRRLDPEAEPAIESDAS